MDGACLQELDVSIVSTSSLGCTLSIAELSLADRGTRARYDFAPSPFMTKANENRKALKLLVLLGGFHQNCPVRLKLEVVFGSAWMAGKCTKEME